MKKIRLLGACGLYCGACYHYRASFSDGIHLLVDAIKKGKDENDYKCQGCRSDKLYVHPGCQECNIRDCTEKKGIIHCGECDEYPCKELKDFQADGHIHHIDIFNNIEEIREKGPEEWLMTQEKRWECSCGTKFSWYETVCQNCGTSLNSYGKSDDHK